MKNIGQLLKSAREKQGLSLEDVAARTKIHIQKLRAIEEGSESDLPAKVFAVGLIKSYARELKVDMQKVDDLCHAAFPQEPELDEPLPSSESSDEPSETQSVGWFQIPKAVSIAASVAVSIALIFIIWGVVSKLNSYTEEERLHVDDLMVGPIKQSTPVTKSKSTPKAKKTLISKGPDKGDKSKSKVARSSDNPKPAAKKDKARKAKEKKAPPKKVDPDSAPPKVVAPTSTSSTAEYRRAKTDNKLVIESLSPVRLEIRWSDGYVQVMLLKSGESKTLVFSSPVQVKVNNGAGVRVSFNSGPFRVPGPADQPTELSYP